MKRTALIALGALLLIAAYSALSPTHSAQAADAQTYTIMVGGEDTTVGAEYLAYFSGDVHVHVGDTVAWKQNAHEIHTVSFLAGMDKAPDLLVPIPNAPAGAVALNPMVAFPAGPKDGQYDGMSFANSGVMGMDPGQAQDFALTFTQPGTYNYVCLVHEGMKGTITVDPAVANPPSSAPILSPAEVATQGQKEMSELAAQVPNMIKAANADVKPDVKNADGTTTHYVTIGYNQGAIDLTAFFPQNLNAAPGDTVVYQLGPHDVAPHTATFLNGQPEPDLVVPQPQPSGPPILAINPAIGMPQNPNMALSAMGIYSSGFMDPSAPGPHEYQYKIGDAAGQYEFECLLHDSNGMKGTLTVSK